MPSKTPNPVAAEALEAGVPVTFRGVSLVIPPSTDWPIDALEAFEDGKVTTFLRAVLGAPQWAALKGVAPTVVDLGEFVQDLQKALGIAGN